LLSAFFDSHLPKMVAYLKLFFYMPICLL